MPKFNQLQTEIVPLVGGVNMVTPQILVKPGTCIFASNFEPDISGGYRRIKGIERFDGHKSPSTMDYKIVEGYIIEALQVGDRIVGTDSGAQATVAAILGVDSFVLTDVQGTWIDEEAFLVGGIIYGYLDHISPDSNASSRTEHALYKSLAADATRLAITPVPGSGSILGVKYWKGNVYAFRNSLDGLACNMFKSSISGWQQITFGKELQFDASTAEIKEGDIISGVTSLATAVVKRSLLRTGTWGSAGAGTLVLDLVVGTFIDNEILQVSAANKATANGSVTDITLQPNGKFEFDVINFYGAVDRERLYFCDGVNKAHEYDGNILVPIRTGVGTDNPKFIVGHKKQLIVSIESELIVSGIGQPYSFTALTGAAQIATGQTITGLKQQTGDTQVGALVVGTDKKIYMLYGNDVSDYILTVHSPEATCVPYTLQNIGFAHFWDVNGLTQLMASQAYGSFQSHILTQAVQPFIDQKKNKTIASCVSRANNLYKIFFTDGDGLNIQIMPNSNSTSPVVGDVMPFNYGNRIVNVADSVVDINGVERKFIGCTDGFVYEIDVGTSIDGDPLESFLILSFNSSRSPDARKNYKRCKLLFDAGSTANIAATYDLSFGTLESVYAAASYHEILGASGYWDTATWDSLFYDSAFSQELTIDTPGNGSSISLIISGSSNKDESFIIEICKLQYTLGRVIR